MSRTVLSLYEGSSILCLCYTRSSFANNSTELCALLFVGCCWCGTWTLSLEIRASVSQLFISVPKNVKRVKICIELISEIRDVTYHRELTVLPDNRHKWTHPALSPTRQAGQSVLDLSTPEGGKAELTWVVGCILRWFTCQQTVTHPSSNLSWCRELRWSKPTR